MGMTFDNKELNAERSRRLFEANFTIKQLTKWGAIIPELTNNQKLEFICDILISAGPGIYTICNYDALKEPSGVDKLKDKINAIMQKLGLIEPEIKGGK